MKTKNFILAGLAGGIIDFLLGWLFYGIMFKEIFPQREESSQTLIFIFLGCLTFGLFIAYIFTKWANITSVAYGLKAGATIGLFIGLFLNFFKMPMHPFFSIQQVITDVGISIIISALIGAIVTLVNQKLS